LFWFTYFLTKDYLSKDIEEKDLLRLINDDKSSLKSNSSNSENNDNSSSEDEICEDCEEGEISDDEEWYFLNGNNNNNNVDSDQKKNGNVSRNSERLNEFIFKRTLKLSNLPSHFGKIDVLLLLQYILSIHLC
jgi:hypothetical protein